MVLMAAIDEPTLRAALEFMRKHDEGPSAVRYPRDNVPEREERPRPRRSSWARPTCSRPDEDLAILAYGFPANHALRAREILAEAGYSVAVYDARFAKPVDLEI